MPVSADVYVNTMKKELVSVVFYRDVIAELIATFFLMAVQCLLPLGWNDSATVVVQTALGMGFVVAATAWVIGDFGGAHMNPAVTLAMVMRAEVTVLRGDLFSNIIILS